ncbi:MAG: peptidoglycan DD-metalloendopeptidase family protein [Candidatus Doudnabacteria bacterium]|nr:peptidoglycan DD-metalloendopeptidase family protein [Candidatus Doudnabacteria bacterium]
MNRLLKPNNKARNVLISALILAVAGFAYLHDPGARSATIDDLNAQKQSVQQKINSLNARIKDYQSQINAVQKQANTLKNQISILDLQITSTQTQIEETENKIDATNLEIADVTNQIIITQNNIDKQKEILRDLIGQINDMDQRSPLEIALENDNFTEFLNDLQYTTSIQERSQEALTKIKALKVDLEERQAELKKQKLALDVLNDQLNEQKNNLNTQRVSKQALLDQTRGQERQYQKLLAISEADQKALFDEINNLDAEIAKKLGNRRLPGIKGLFAWPMDGTMTQGYGNTGFTSLGYSFHNGIDLAAAPGTPIYAAADGTVLGTGTGNGAYGNWVTIKHPMSAKYGNRALVSLYGHMSSFVLKPGQTVKQGDLVGFEGNTGNTTRLLYGPHRGYHLHFTVFDFEGYGVNPGTLTKQFGNYKVPFGATYNPLDYL